MELVWNWSRLISVKRVDTALLLSHFLSISGNALTQVCLNC